MISAEKVLDILKKDLTIFAGHPAETHIGPKPLLMLIDAIESGEVSSENQVRIVFHEAYILQREQQQTEQSANEAQKKIHGFMA